jgi:putative transposase
MLRIDELHLQYPFARAWMVFDILQRNGHGVLQRHVATLMLPIGIAAIYHMPRTSQQHPTHRNYRYLLCRLMITQPNHILAADYYVHSDAPRLCVFVRDPRLGQYRVLAWWLSNTLTTDFCQEVVWEVITRYDRPEVFKTDQGCQFTNHEFTRLLKGHDNQISMNRTGRWRGNASSSGYGGVSNTNMNSLSPCIGDCPRRPGGGWYATRSSIISLGRIVCLTDARPIARIVTTSGL